MITQHRQHPLAAPAFDAFRYAAADARRKRDAAQLDAVINEIEWLADNLAALLRMLVMDMPMMGDNFRTVTIGEVVDAISANANTDSSTNGHARAGVAR